jgi:hypothetical protein
VALGRSLDQLSDPPSPSPFFIRPTTRTSTGIANTFTYDEGAYGKGRLTRTNDGTGR